MKITFTIVFLFFQCFVIAQSTKPVMDLAHRQFPWISQYLELKIMDSEKGKDFFSIETKKKKIFISGNNNNSLAKGLGHYLKTFSYRSISHLGDNNSKPSKIIFPKEKITVTSPFQYCYALNYCTISYSMAFYDWKNWERELDWMALNGVNLMLAPIGTEIIWQRTLQKFGYNEIETKDFISPPVFSAWWQMGNLEGWGGKMSNEMVEEQRILAHKIFARMHDFSISPIYQGFYGIIPTSFKKKFDVKVIEQGKWAGDFQRPDFLITDDPYFNKISDVYYSEIKKEYGNFRFFGGDPFHEGGVTQGIDVGQASVKIQQAMQKYFPNSTWVLQGWHQNPKKEILADIDKNNVLVIELFGENTNNWELRNGYENTNFIWSSVNNFGEKNGIYGKLQRFADEIYRAKNSKYSLFLKGIGIIPEGIYNNPVVYDQILQLGWTDEKMNTKNWIKNYTKYRYGNQNDNIDKAWELLLQTAYSSPNVYQEGPSESIFCARPALGLSTVSSWGTLTRNYNQEQFKDAVKIFVNEEKNFKKSETYQTDKIDFLRQVLSNKGLNLYHEIEKNIQQKDLSSFNKNSEQFLKLILLQDSLLSINKNFSLYTFLNKAISSTKLPAGQMQNLKNAKMQITIWGPADNAKTNLRDYAHKEWSGILRSLYYNRWKTFFENEKKILEGKKPEILNYFEMEKQWIFSKNLYPEKAIFSKNITDIEKEILK